MLRRVLSIYWSAPGGRPLLVTLLMLLASTADLFSMGAIVPLVAQITADGGQDKSYVARFIGTFMQTLGINPSFDHLLIFIGLGMVVKSLIQLVSLSFVGVAVADVTTGIRTRMLDAMVHANWAYFTDHKPGEVASQISAQSGQAGQAYQQATVFVTNVASSLGLVTAAVLISPQLMVLTILALILVILPLNAIVRIADRVSQQQFTSTNALNTELEDVVNNMKPLKSMGRQESFIENFGDHILRLRKTLIQVVVSRQASFNLQDIISTFLLLGGVWLAVSVMKVPLSQFLVFGIVFFQIIDVMKRVQQSFQDAVVAAATYHGVMETIHRGEAEEEIDQGTIEPTLNTRLHLDDVSFAYGPKSILSHINAEVPAGKITVLVGPSGAGKTTFLDLIIGFNRPTKGRILIDKTDLKDIRLQSWRRQIGYVPQELTLLRGSVADNIALGDRRISDADILAALKLAGGLEFVQALPKGIHNDIGTMGAKLSGGQRQRISLARALVHKPKLLLLDEVTSALDDQTEQEICRNIQSLSGTLTILAITHRPAWKNIADRIYKIQQGKAVLDKVPARRKRA
ncbi:ATP-binding cassette domain-containing protein [Aestuariivirga litoralis]|uniref:ATP-binding cassette domain-containing protein n=1 Tax=Aestuariivirga litoralis TaxID=2650924 RepID=UPI0018C5FD00